MGRKRSVSSGATNFGLRLSAWGRQRKLAGLSSRHSIGRSRGVMQAASAYVCCPPSTRR